MTQSYVANHRLLLVYRSLASLREEDANGTTADTPDAVRVAW